MAARLDCPSRLARYDEQRVARIDPRLHLPNLNRIRAVEDDQLWPVLGPPERRPYHLRRQAGAALPEEHNPCHAVGDHLASERPQTGYFAHHSLGHRQPIQPVRDLRWVRLPDRVVTLPDATNNPAFGHRGEASIDGRCDRAEGGSSRRQAGLFEFHSRFYPLQPAPESARTQAGSSAAASSPPLRRRNPGHDRERRFGEGRARGAGRTATRPPPRWPD